MQLLARIAPDVGYTSTPCNVQAHAGKSLDLRCCLADEQCVSRHASQLTWVAVPQLLRTHIFTLRTGGSVVEVEEVGEARLLSVLNGAKAPLAEARHVLETHKLWRNFVAMSALLPHSRRLRSVALDRALHSVTRGQTPGDEVAIFSEFSRCVF